MADVMFLPGIVAPASMRYAALLQHFTEPGTAVTKELEIYSSPDPSPGYSMQSEIDGVTNAADQAGFDRFHLYGHSGGGAIALAYAAIHGDRLLSLAVDEPASDFTPEDKADPTWADIERATHLAPEEATPVFLQLQLHPAITPPPPPPGPPPPWMVTRPAAMRVFVEMLQRHHVDPARYRAFGAPVLFTRGTLSHPRWEAMEARLAALFGDFRCVVFEGLHHLNTSHQAEPARVASLLNDLWR